jgi:hypothetical protein
MADNSMLKVAPQAQCDRHPVSRPGAFMKLLSVELAVYLTIGIASIVKILINSFWS